MYIERLHLENVRTFADSRLEFVHPERVFRKGAVRTAADRRLLPLPKLPNVNLLLGDNGAGKSTVLRAIAAAAFGPAAQQLLRDATLVRFGVEEAKIFANLRLHEQDRALGQEITADVLMQRKGERLLVTVGPPQYEQVWEPVYESKNDAFFVVGYGATRRVERLDSFDPGARIKSRSQRDLRVQSLFEESFSLIPLAGWLHQLRTTNPGRYKQVAGLLNALLAPAEWSFTGRQDDRGDYLFQHGQTQVPFQALSDGYRAFIGWVADLLYHVCYGCPSGKKLVDGRGVVLVDEIDLHLHPKWQMKVIQAVGRSLPRMQFILTSHSPLVAGSLEWMNIITLKTGAKTNRTVAKRLQQSVRGLDADQILLTGFFGLKTTRAASKRNQINDLAQRAGRGDKQAAHDVILAMSRGEEVES